jgi:hydrogenase large subunit
MSEAPRRVVVGPFNRVEGDLEITLDIADGRVAAARVNSPLYRGFEKILAGKDPRDALVIAPRICGICSVSQSMAAAYALADAQGLAMPRNGELATNLVLAGENVADHFTHFYLFFMPDFAREAYAGEPWHAAAAERFRAASGGAAREAIPARAALLHLMGLLAGKWPHTLSVQPGGSTRPVLAQERLRLLAQLGEFRRFLERVTFGDDLEVLVGLDSADALAAWADAGPAHGSDLRHFLKIADALQLDALGRAADRFMSYGGYREEGRRLFAPGVWDGVLGPVDTAAIREDVTHSWMHGECALHPSEGDARPDPDKAGAYSWCKAPRLDGRVVEVGALARQAVDGHALIRDLVQRSGGNVRSRVVARLLELARVVLAMQEWARALSPGEPFCVDAPLPDTADGVGLVEAARGSLGHWLSIRDGRVANYQIVAPTTWNFSPRDAAGTPGALEQALVGAPLRHGEDSPLAAQHIVRSFDPCMVCTVH